MTSGFLYLEEPIFKLRGVCFFIIVFLQNTVFTVNSVALNQTRRSAASDLGLHCLQMSLLWDARHKWINQCNLILFLFLFCFYFTCVLKGRQILYRTVCVPTHAASSEEGLF